MVPVVFKAKVTQTVFVILCQVKEKDWQFNMSSGKRLAKRSIVGTRVMAPSPSAAAQGLYEPALIQSMRIFEDPAVGNRYVVKFEESR